MTGSFLYRAIAVQTLEYALREMQGREDGFSSAQEAEPGGVEGAFYVWALDEIRSPWAREKTDFG
jgi:uncharacterized protein YyaL (SSP411 family)